MRYAALTRENTISEFIELTADEYAALPTIDKVNLYEAEDPAITIDYIFENQWHSPEDIRDREFAAGPDAYKTKYTELVNAWRAGWFAYGFVYNGDRFKGEGNDQLWMNAFLQLLSDGITTPPVNWITMDNYVVQFNTIDEFKALAGFFFNWAQSITFQCLQLKAAIRDATSRADIDNIYLPFVEARTAEGVTPKFE